MQVIKYFTNKEENFLNCDFKTIVYKNSPWLKGNNYEIEVPDHWNKSACDLFFNHYLFKGNIPTKLRLVPEDGIPQWLQRKEPDYNALNTLDETEKYAVETKATSVFNRIAGAWTYIGYKNNYFDSEESAKNFFLEMQYILCHQIATPSSPQWYNTGLHWSYGITGAANSKHFYVDEESKSIKSTSCAYERPQTSSCFIQSVEDNLLEENGVYDLIKKEAAIFKYGSGTSTNFSSIRGKGEKISTGGFSSGAVSFMKISDQSAGVMKLGGTLTRAAKMISLDMDHPDIVEFINWKVKEEQKVVSLVSGSNNTYKAVELITNACNNFEGKEEDKFVISKNKKLQEAIFIAKSLMIPLKFIRKALFLVKQNEHNFSFQTFTTGMNTESYQSVGGYNCNTAVMTNDEFMKKASSSEDKSWNLINRRDGSVNSSIDAGYLLDLISYSTWSCSAPTLQFKENINYWNTCKDSGTITTVSSSNEFLFLDNTSANLASINVIKFKNKDNSLNYEGFIHVVSLLTIAMDISVIMAQYPSKEIAINSYKYRPIGIGCLNLSSYLMSCGISYKSEEGRTTIATILALLTGSSYYQSTQLAKKLGAFASYMENSKSMREVLSNQLSLLSGNKISNDKYIPLEKEKCLDTNLYLNAVKIWENALSEGKKYGFRNAQVSCLAPSSSLTQIINYGTAGLNACDSILVNYPEFDGSYKLALEKSLVKGLKSLNYTTEEIEEIHKHILGHKHFNNCPHINYDTLSAKGFTKEIISKIESSIESVHHIKYAFHKHVIGENFCKEILKIDTEILKDPNIALLSLIGFSEEEIEEANKYVLGHKNIKDCKIISKEHKDVFFFAEEYEDINLKKYDYSELNMIARCQPFLSGGINKQINIPVRSLIADCKEIYIKAWEMGIKSIEIYRSGSKLSQTLIGKIEDDASEDINIIDYLSKK